MNLNATSFDQVMEHTYYNIVSVVIVATFFVMQINRLLTPIIILTTLNASGLCELRMGTWNEIRLLFIPTLRLVISKQEIKQKPIQYGMAMTLQFKNRRQSTSPKIRLL